MHIRTVIVLGQFCSFGLRDVVNLSTTFFIQRFFTVFIFFIKARFLTFFILGVNVFYIYGARDPFYLPTSLLLPQDPSSTPRHIIFTFFGPVAGTTFLL